ncbi:MAG TPA: hypothetical protein VGO22_03940 [Pseudorhizobium sp.]|jgi:hypothetical protein|nr:hypothetical protein [Pseudorhizobium sp.]
MAKDRYGCTNRQKKLPIEHLGGIVCTNSKTISRAELEKRVVAAIPDNLLGVDNVDRLNREMSAWHGQRQIKASAEPARLVAEINALEVTRRALGETIVDRMMAGRQRLRRSMPSLMNWSSNALLYRSDWTNSHLERRQAALRQSSTPACYRRRSKH